MNTLESNKDLYPSQRQYPQIKNLFESLNISEQEKEKILSRFYSIAKNVYEKPEGISSDNIVKIKLGETDSESFKIQSDYEGDIIGKYLNFIQSYPNGEKIWRTLTAYYNPNKL